MGLFPARSSLKDRIMMRCQQGLFRGFFSGGALWDLTPWSPHWEGPPRRLTPAGAFDDDGPGQVKQIVINDRMPMGLLLEEWGGGRRRPRVSEGEISY